MKVQLSMNDELVARIDAYAEKNYLTRSGFVSQACTQYLASVEMVQALTGMAKALRQIADVGKVTEEDMRKLEDYERFIKYLQATK